MTKYKVTDFNNRTDLENQIITDLGRTVDKKDATITGTVLQLAQLGLQHNQTIWGVTVVASNYKPKEHGYISRGDKRHPTKLNGVKV